MNRRSVLRRTGLGFAALASAGLAGCSGNGDDGETTAPDGNGGGGNGNDHQTTVPELEVSERSLESSVDGLSVIGYRDDYRPGGRHDDVHFAVVPAVENTGDQETNLGDYSYGVTLYDADGEDVTPGDPWTGEPVTVDPGETGTILVQVSFIDSDVPPENVDSYEVTVSCDGGGGSYC